MSEDKTQQIKERVAQIADGITNNMYSNFSLVDWHPLLAKECQVYVYGETYLAKRFDQIHFQFCTRDKAKEILIDNLYALLRYKYFPKATDEIQDKIDKIIKSFTTNLKTVLIRVAFEPDEDCEKVSLIPDGCIAFRNGVFDFRNNRWLFLYNKIEMPKQSNRIYLYNPRYIIQWYVNINFDPLDIDVENTSLNEFIDIIKSLDQINKNYCFELMYNMSHDINHVFQMRKFIHLCEIIGYLCLQSFSQNFIMLIGSGQNGKNSLIDGCFSSRIVPAPANIDIKSIENDNFITGALENKTHNFFLETEAETMIQSKMLKALTGSMYQNIQHKGIDRYSGIINTKHLWAANDQEMLKFSDTTIGFRRRINIYEVWFRWDSKDKYLERGDYYDTRFSEDLSEIKQDLINIVTFIYFGLYGIKSATANYTRSFKFNYNDWNLQYTDINFDLKDKVESITQERLALWFSNIRNRENGKLLFYDLNKRALYLSDLMREYGIHNYDEYVDIFIKDSTEADLFFQFFAEHDVYMSVKLLQDLVGNADQGRAFIQELKKSFNLNQIYTLSGNKPYVRVTYRNNKLRIVS